MGSWIWSLLILVVYNAAPAIIMLVAVLVVVWFVRRAPATAPPPVVSAEARLQELAGLLHKGLITQAEYEQRRAEVIAGV